MPRTTIILPADVYDALEFSALVYGGIGAGAYRDYASDDYDNEAVAPRCILGHGAWITDAGYVGNADVFPVLVAAGIDERFNDTLVHDALKAGKGNPRTMRISFGEYVALAGIVRGEA